MPVAQRKSSAASRNASNPKLKKKLAVKKSKKLGYPTNPEERLTSALRGQRTTSTSTVTVEMHGQTLTLPVTQDRKQPLKSATMTDLGQRAAEVITDVEQGIPVLLTKRGKFIGLIVPVNSSDVERTLFSVATAPSRPRLVANNAENLLPLEAVAKELGLSEPTLDN